MQYRTLCWMLAVALTVGFSGCFSTEPGEDRDTQSVLNEVTPGELVQEITRMAKTDEESRTDPRRHIYTRRLASMGPKTLSPLVEFMAAPDIEGEARLFMLQCLAGLMTSAYLAELEPLLASEDPVVRACGITLVGHIEDPEVMPLLQAAMADSDPRVRFSALSSRAVQGDPAARTELSRKYYDDDTVDLHKREVLRVLLIEPEEGDVNIFREALDAEFLHISMRALVANALGLFADASVIESIEKSMDTYTDPVYTEIASTAIDTIKARAGQASAGR